MFEPAGAVHVGSPHWICRHDATGNVSALVVQVGEAFSAGRALVLFNDVWLPDDAIRELMGALPEKVSVLITTGAVLIPRTDPQTACPL